MRLLIFVCVCVWAQPSRPLYCALMMSGSNCDKPHSDRVIITGKGQTLLLALENPHNYPHYVGSEVDLSFFLDFSQLLSLHCSNLGARTGYLARW